MFCQLARLRRCLSPRIRRALDELPETLDETYERTLLDIDDENWAYAHRLFQCIVVACRPLRVEELAEFLAFKLGAGGSLTFEENWRPENARDTVLSTCSSLIAVVDVEGSPVIQFSHFSVKEYLTSNRIAEGHVSRYHVPLETAHQSVTQACLSFLLQLDKHVTKTSVEELPLARYAGQYWVNHAKVGNVSSHTEDLIKRVLHPEHHHFANWVWIYDTISGRSMHSERPSRSGSSPLHYAALYGFHQVAEWLIITCSQDVNVTLDMPRWPYGRLYPMTSLHVASELGQFTVVQVLLANHADVNAGGEYNRTSLHFAVREEHPKVVRLLLENGADVNSKTDFGITPLYTLSDRRGSLEVAQILLEHGANPSLRSRNGMDSLYKALQMSYRGLARLLVKYGADPNTRDHCGKTLLHVSSNDGYYVAEGLLEFGADVNAEDNNGNTPLQEALRNRNERVVQLLLQHGAKKT